jgi:CheY-like chemotaxis protein
MRAPHLLIVGPDAGTGHLLTAILVDAGYRVTAVASLPNAFDLVRRSAVPVDLVIVDQDERPGDIDAFGRQGRRGRPSLRIIALQSARGFKRASEEPGVPGAHAVLRKPFRTPELLEAVALQLAGTENGGPAPVPPLSPGRPGGRWWAGIFG